MLIRHVYTNRKPFDSVVELKGVNFEIWKQIFIFTCKNMAKSLPKYFWKSSILRGNEQVSKCIIKIIKMCEIDF